MSVVIGRPDKKIKETSFSWEGKDRSGKVVKGEMRAAGAIVVTSTLRRQGIRVTKVTKTKIRGTIRDKDITLFTRQYRY